MDWLDKLQNLTGEHQTAGDYAVGDVASDGHSAIRCYGDPTRFHGLLQLGEVFGTRFARSQAVQDFYQEIGIKRHLLPGLLIVTVVPSRYRSARYVPSYGHAAAVSADRPGLALAH